MIPSFSMEGNPQAKKEQLLIYMNQATTMYKSKGKYKSKLSPSIYKQYSKSGSWVKVKNSKTQKYLWIKNVKSLSKLPTKTNATMEKEIVTLVNKERKKRGISSLKVDTSLKEYTHFRSNDRAMVNYFGHSSPKYGRWANFFIQGNINFHLQVRI